MDVVIQFYISNLIVTVNIVSQTVIVWQVHKFLLIPISLFYSRMTMGTSKQIISNSMCFQCGQKCQIKLLGSVEICPWELVWIVKKTGDNG